MTVNNLYILLKLLQELKKEYPEVDIEYISYFINQAIDTAEDI